MQVWMQGLEVVSYMSAAQLSGERSWDFSLVNQVECGFTLQHGHLRRFIVSHSHSRDSGGWILD